eukprot:XP_014039825.1 PREDICTED: monocarboxylate transporter 7-like [Salmo salar]
MCCHFLMCPGLGYCLTFLPTVTILSQYFNRRRSLVTALASSGESFAMFAFAPAFMALKEIIGWRHCLIVIGLMQASVIGCGALLRPIIIRPDQEVSGEVSNKEKLSVKLQTVYELENEDTQTNVSSGESEESGDSGVTSLSASSADLRATTATQDPSETRALMEDQGEKNQGGQATLGTPQNQLEAGEKPTNLEGFDCCCANLMILEGLGRSLGVSDVASCVFSPGLLVDKTQNYGSAFYSCAVGMGLGAIFLAMVGPAKSGLCLRGKTRKQEEEGEEEGEEERGGEEEEKVSQDSGSADYLDVDLTVETSPAKWSPKQETNVV